MPTNTYDDKKFTIAAAEFIFLDTPRSMPSPRFIRARLHIFSARKYSVVDFDMISLPFDARNRRSAVGLIADDDMLASARQDDSKYRLD